MWEAEYNGVKHGPYPEEVHQKMKQNPVCAKWIWRKIKPVEVVAPLEAKKVIKADSKKKDEAEK